MTRQKSGHASATYEEGDGVVLTILRLIVVVSCVAAFGAVTCGLLGPRELGGEAEPLSTVPFETVTTAPVAVLPTQTVGTPDVSFVPSASPLPGFLHVGVVAGHWGSDPGAVCPDGLTEAEINLDVAQRVVHLLEDLGYRADLLAEFDPLLQGYQAGALVSIHADSCEDYPDATPPASGFKVASVEDSAVPEAEARLVSCLAQCYAARTGLYFHENSITYDMTRYHTFYEIDSQTPAVIIEIGFMMKDRYLLTQQADLVAQGIAEGIVCFFTEEPQ